MRNAGGGAPTAVSTAVSTQHTPTRRTIPCALVVFCVLYRPGVLAPAFQTPPPPVLEMLVHGRVGAYERLGDQPETRQRQQATQRAPTVERTPCTPAHATRGPKRRSRTRVFRRGAPDLLLVLHLVKLLLRSHLGGLGGVSGSRRRRRLGLTEQAAERAFERVGGLVSRVA